MASAFFRQVGDDMVGLERTEQRAQHRTQRAQERLDVGAHQHLGRTAERPGRKGLHGVPRHVRAEVAREAFGDDFSGAAAGSGHQR
jgi:hypothetical protein